MQGSFFIFLGIFFILYGLINYYTGLKIKRIFINIFPGLNGKFYWIIFWLLALSYVIVRLIRRILPDYINGILLEIGAYWLGALYYFILFFMAFDLILLLNRWAGIININVRYGQDLISKCELGMMLLIASMVIYGAWNARQIDVQQYNLNIPKEGKNINELHIVMVSDVHLGNIVGNDFLSKLVNKINEMNPDLILFTGDLVDEGVGPFVRQNMGDTLNKLKAKYGVFAVLGNHEYFGGDTDLIVQHLEKSGIKVLRDEHVIIKDSFYIIGRNDYVMERIEGRPRKDLSELVKDMDMSLPVILMDHTPRDIEEAQNNGIDLLLSGHTHRGQLFPNNFITGKIFEIDWGYLKKENLNIIVSSGCGTWGPPIRIGSNSEIVHILIDFK